MVFIQGWKVLDSWDDPQAHMLGFKRRGWPEPGLGRLGWPEPGLGKPEQVEAEFERPEKDSGNCSVGLQIPRGGSVRTSGV